MNFICIVQPFAKRAIESKLHKKNNQKKKRMNQFFYPLQLTENDTLVGTAGDHLYLVGLIGLVEKANGSDRRAVIVEGLQEIVSLIDAEHVN